MTKPPVTGATHALPFDKLSPRDFERLEPPRFLVPFVSFVQFVAKNDLHTDVRLLTTGY